MTLKPLADRVVVKPSQAEEKTKGGIIVPDTAKEKPVWGEVVAAGPGRVSDDGKLIPMEVKVGDRVLYGKYSGTEVTIDGEELLIMRESDIFAIMPKK
ncbi:MAG: co-chaperone GroES [Ignavibacteria bacterium]|nr:co-chaperone GroES [Ignavibacteria bacterium]